MSHEVKGQVEVKDLNAFEAATKELGGVFHRDKRTYTMFKGELPCEHAVSFPGIRYQIGVKTTEKKGVFEPVWDTFGYDNSAHDGHKLVERVGPNMSRLKQIYGLNVAERAAKRKGHRTRRKIKSNGTIQLVIGG